MKLWIAAAAIAVLSGASLAHDEVALSIARQAKVRAGVLENLRDPQSARFGLMRARMEGGVLWVCGTVNAKNAYGGYTGFLPGGAYMGRLTASGFIVDEMGPRALGARCAALGVMVR